MILPDRKARILPLSGLRVFEFTHAVMGPTAGLLLADLGAAELGYCMAELGRLKDAGTIA